MKQILNNLWSQRGQNVWLFAELVVVCFVAWTQLDPIVVRLFYRNLPVGFDIDRLVVADVAEIKSVQDGGSTPEEIYERADELFKVQAKLLKEHLLAQEGVESVSFLDDIGGYPRMLQHLMQQPCGNDTIFIPWCYFNEEEDFFETFGIHPVAGSPSQHEMSTDFRGNQTLIITRSLAERAYGSAEAALGKQIRSEIRYDGVYFTQTIGGVVEDVSAFDTEYSSWMIFSPNGRADLSSIKRIAIRLKPGVNMQRFIEEQNYHIGELATEYLTLSGFTPYQKVESWEKSFNKSHDYDFNLSVATAIFFLINLCLGVIGTFWMQTKRRTEESGIMRAFGATKRRIMGLFLAEGFVLTTISMLITCVLYINYVKTGLGELCIPSSTQPDPTWVADKPLHFLIISGIVYLIILTTVSIGILIPSWNIVRTKPVEALREE
jgi:cell division protein FtsX